MIQSQEPIIINKSISGDLKRYVAVIRLVVNGVTKSYYYKRTLTKKERKNKQTIREAILVYQGSSKGKGIPSNEFMEDWGKVTEPPTIELLEQNPPESQIGFKEQYYITKHREDFPNDTINSKDNCYNKNNGNVGSKEYGVVSNEYMLNHINAEILKEEITKQRLGKSPSFDKISLSRKELREIWEAGNFIQSRVKLNNAETVARYAGKIAQLPNLKDDFNKLQIYLPENPDNTKEVGDGNESYLGFEKHKKHKEMWGYAIPYEWHKYLTITSKEDMGNWFNKPEEDAGDIRSIEDLERNLRNLIAERRDVLVKEDDTIDMDHPFIDQIFTDQQCPESYISTIKSKIATEFRKKRKAEIKREENSHDYSNASLSSKNSLFQQESFDAYNEIMDNVNKDWPKYEIKRVGQTKIKEDSFNHIINIKIDTGNYPKYLIIVVWFDLINEYKKFKNEKSRELKQMNCVIDIFKKSGIDTKYILLNPEKDRGQKGYNPFTVVQQEGEIG